MSSTASTPWIAIIFQAAITCRATHFLTGDLQHFAPLLNQPDLACSLIVQTVVEFTGRTVNHAPGSHHPKSGDRAGSPRANVPDDA